jgi:hypothetical protein
MKKPDYQPRVIDSLVENYLQAFGGVEIAGTMWSGKTWTSEQHANSDISLVNSQTRELAKIDPAAILKGDTPRVIDEWQEVPEIWDVARQWIDNAAGTKGLFLLTGSSTPAKDKTHHSGAGRIARLRMWPMTLFETNNSDGSVSLADLFDGKFSSGPTQTDLNDLARFICRGGWPAAIELTDAAASLVPASYLEAFADNAQDKTPIGVPNLKALLASLARNIGSAATLDTLAKDVFQVQEVSASQRQLISAGLDYLERHYVVSPMTGWDAPIKSPQRLRVKPKRVFADPSLPAALLGMSPERLMTNMQVFGQLFEEMCLRDLAVYSQVLPNAGLSPLHYYRDSDGLEVDAIIELNDGRWGAFEIKLGANKAQAAEKNLLRLKNKIASNPAARNPEPAFLAVLTGKTDFKYKMESGVLVLPITSLAP